jgi:hypothetical protein
MQQLCWLGVVPYGVLFGAFGFWFSGFTNLQILTFGLV